MMALGVCTSKFGKLPPEPCLATERKIPANRLTRVDARAPRGPSSCSSMTRVLDAPTSRTLPSFKVIVSLLLAFTDILSATCTGIATAASRALPARSMLAVPTSAVMLPAATCAHTRLAETHNPIRIAAKIEGTSPERDEWRARHFASDLPQLFGPAANHLVVCIASNRRRFRLPARTYSAPTNSRERGQIVEERTAIRGRTGWGPSYAASSSSSPGSCRGIERK